MKKYLRHACIRGLSVFGYEGTRCPHCGNRIDASMDRARLQIFTRAEVIQIAGFLSAELGELHTVEAPLILEATEKAMVAVSTGSHRCGGGR